MPINPPTDDAAGLRTRAQLRQTIITLMGWAVMAIPPPGVEAFVNEQLRLAHALLWQRFPEIRLRRWFSWTLIAGERFYARTGNDEATGLGTPPAPGVNGNDGGGTLADGTYSYRLARIDADGRTTLPGPAGTASPSGFDTGACEVYLLAPTPRQVAWAIYGRSGGSEALLTTVDVADVDPLAPYWLDTGADTPDGAVETVDGTITSTATLDAYGLGEVWLERDSARTRLIQGLPRGELAREQTGWPTHFDLANGLELWPAPADDDSVLRVHGRQANTGLASDSDVPGVPDDMVELLALAACKRHYRHPDANDYIQMQEVLVNNLVAGSHGARRYLPGECAAPSGYVEPVPNVPFD